MSKVSFLGGSAAMRETWEMGSVPGLGRPPGEGSGNPIQDSCPEASTDRGAWRATVHGVSIESDETARLSPAQHRNWYASDCCVL